MNCPVDVKLKHLKLCGTNKLMQGESCNLVLSVISNAF